MRGAHRGVCCSKSTPLIEAELFAAQSKRSAPDGRALLCAADNARKIQGNKASRNLPDARNRAPSPSFSRECFAERLKGRFGGVKRGQGNHTVPFSPFAPAVGTAAMPGLPIGSHSSPPAAHRCIGGKAYRQPTVKKGFPCGGRPPERRNRSPSTEGKSHERQVASTGCAAVSAEGLPSAEGKSSLLFLS